MYEQGMSIPQQGGALMGATAGYVGPKSAYNEARPQAQEVGHVAQGVGEQERLTSALLDEINMLESRFAGVLRPAPPVGQGSSPATPTPMRSSLADALDQFNGRISVALYRLRDIAARADI